MGIAGAVLPGASFADFGQVAAPTEVTEEQIKVALKLANLSFADEEVKEMVGSVKGFGAMWPTLREVSKDAGFMGMNYRVVPDTIGPRQSSKRTMMLTPPQVQRPESDEDLAFMSVMELSALLRSKKVTSVELTTIYLNRLKKYGPKLRCVVNLCEERALKQAALADEKLQGRIHTVGLLCGIPFGVKDLFDAKGYPTTWGIRTRKDHIAEEDSDVVRLLERAGAVLVAKLSLGALAMGDVWFEGRTESPWDARIGSSGSSAGSGSAVAAGLVPFAIGTETNGSLVSPAHNCRVTTLRPTFGSVSRDKAMALCWSLDKVGPLCRTAEDCALIFSVIASNTGRDPGQIERNFEYSKVELSTLKWGYLVFKEEDVKSRIDDASRPWLKVLREMGIEPEPVYLPECPEGMDAILYAECAAAFESFTRSADIQDLEGYSSWPETFRSGRLIPAVEYIQADRYRVILAKIYGDIIGKFDVLLADDRLYPRIYGLNVTGIPQMLIPAGVDDRGRARSFSMVSPILQESKMLSAAHQLQEKMGFHKLRPDMKIWE